MLPIVLLGASGPNFTAALQQLQGELQANYSEKACRIQQILVCQELMQQDVIDLSKPRGVLVCHLVALLVDSQVEDNELQSIQLMKPLRDSLPEMLQIFQHNILPVLQDLVSKEAERYNRKSDRQEKQERCTHEWDVLLGRDMRTGNVIDGNPHDPISICALCELKVYTNDRNQIPVVGLPKDPVNE